MKKKLIRIGILAAVFVVAVIVISFITNKGNADMTADLKAATLPQISFTSEGYTVNTLAGYVTDMSIPAMRDTITPLGADGRLNVIINAYENKIEKLSYNIYTMNGETVLLKGKVSKPKSEETLDLGSALAETQEGVLKLTVVLDKKEVYYYTRIIKPEGLEEKSCLDFVNEFHSKAIQNQDSAFLSGLIEVNSEGDNTTLHEVNIHSELSQITWGKLAPEIIGNVKWNIKEINPTYTSVQLIYQVGAVNAGGETDVFNVKEFFRVRMSQGKMYLLDYDRTMNQLFDGAKSVISEKGLELGIGSSDISYMTNNDGTVVSFIQERELWNYNKEMDELSLVFSFANSESKDIRNLYDQHEVKLINVDKKGNTTFAIYGYMNRGEHEGESGVAVYYFNISQNSVEEKVFIPGNEPYGIVKHDLNKLVYYSQADNALYVMVEGTLYKVKSDKDERETLVKNLQEGQYISSSDGHLLAYQNNGTVNDATSITVLNLTSGESKIIDAEENECIRPLGFIYGDFVYGIAKKEDMGKTISGEGVLPMYKIEIRDSKNKLAKTYQIDQVYTLDVIVNDNMITLNRATKNGELYTGIVQDYITNNQKKEESNISLETYITDEKKSQMRLKYEDGIKDKNPKILKPKQVLFENTTTVEFDAADRVGCFYLYAKGEMMGIFEKAGYAVQMADSVGGVVTSSGQACVWEKGNRDLRYEIPGLDGIIAADGESTLAAGIRTLIEREGVTANVSEEFAKGKSPMEVLDKYTGGEALDLTGCSVEEALYIISRGKPVVALIDSTNAILLVGYDSSTVTYIDLSTGIKTSVPTKFIEDMTVGSGNTFIGYVK